VRITCVGGGPAGLYFSLLMKLRDPRHDVLVLERNPTGAVHGLGVTLGQDMLDTLRDNDSASADELERAARRWTHQIVHLDRAQESFDGFNISSIGREALVDILARRATEVGVQIKYGHEVATLAELPDSDLVVIADGVGSRLRSAVDGFGTHISKTGNQHMWLGSNVSLDTFNYIFAPTPHGWMWAYAYQFEARTSTFIVEGAPGTLAASGLDTMPADDAAALLSDVFKDHLDGHPLTARLPDGSLARWLDFRIIDNERWHVGNLVLAGDSAHTAHFSLGQGTQMALGDAIALADSLERHADLETALTAYETRRKAELARPLSEARCSAEWFEDLPRYIKLTPHQFGTLLQVRWSPLIRMLPPRLSYQLHHLTRRFTVLNKIRSRIGPAVKVLYGRRNSVSTKAASR
jgi:2-polyprenyl-6-methoxyphenol hydroxylase-like FAD-dependent oxidoreductase